MVNNQLTRASKENDGTKGPKNTDLGGINRNRHKKYIGNTTSACVLIR